MAPGCLPLWVTRRRRLCCWRGQPSLRRRPAGRALRPGPGELIGSSDGPLTSSAAPRRPTSLASSREMKGDCLWGRPGLLAEGSGHFGAAVRPGRKGVFLRREAGGFHAPLEGLTLRADSGGCGTGCATPGAGLRAPRGSGGAFTGARPGPCPPGREGCACPFKQTRTWSWRGSFPDPSGTAETDPSCKCQTWD